MLTILHASDLQCGRPFLQPAADAFVRAAHEIGADVVVLAGDLTQRAKPREFSLARAFWDRLPDTPIVTTPGNHDVPLYRVWERVFAPYRNWCRYVGTELNTVDKVGVATLVALNSSAPRRAIVGGRVDASQIDFARAAFGARQADEPRVLVLHHHFLAMPDGKGGRPLPGARSLLAAIEDMEVDAVLGGHVHRTSVRTSRDVLADRSGPGVPLIASGTTTSVRGRGPEERSNSFNVVRLGATEIRVQPYLRADADPEFRPQEEIVLPRPGTVSTMSARAQEDPE